MCVVCLVWGYLFDEKEFDDVIVVFRKFGMMDWLWNCDCWLILEEFDCIFIYYIEMEMCGCVMILMCEIIVYVMFLMCC